MFDILYDPYKDAKAVFGDHWCHSGSYEWGKDTFVAFYPKEKGGDGQHVEVYCCALPALFYQIRVIEGWNSLGVPLPAWTLATGSSMADTAALLAQSISEGMLVLENKA